jgi:hypothetical protein
MRSIAAALLVAGLLGGCDSANAPAAIRPTVDQIEAMGYECGSGVPDNVPSGLVAWNCSGSVAGNRAGVMVEGNDDGVAGITLVIHSNDPGVIRTEFRRLAAAVPPMSLQPDVDEALDAWTGSPSPMILGGTRVNALCDVTQCIVYIGYREAPAQPLVSPLPT